MKENMIDKVIRAMDCLHVGRRFWFDVRESSFTYLKVTDVKTDKVIYPSNSELFVSELLTKSEIEQIEYLEQAFSEAI